MAVIVFSHANGFPAGTYRVVLDAWRAAGHRVLAPDKFGHDPKHPVTSNWPHVRDELIGFIEREAPGQAVQLVGHSLGGYLSLLVACHRPDLAAAVVLLDSPVVGGWRARALRFGKATGLMKRFSPGRVSRARRQAWPSADAAFAHFAAKPAFARWDPRVLADYIACGTEPADDGGVRLSFRREIETRFYNTLPHHFDRVLKRHPPRCPVGFVGGRHSTENRQAGLAVTQAVVGDHWQWIDGSHLFPMEQPQATADTVLALLDRMGSIDRMKEAA